MIDFFYSLPIWLATILVLALSLTVGLASSFGLRKLLRLRSTDEDTAHAVSLMQVVAAYIGILIAFAGVQVWQDFADAQNAVHREAACASQLYRDLATYGPGWMREPNLEPTRPASFATNGRCWRRAGPVAGPRSRCSGSTTPLARFGRRITATPPFTLRPFPT